MISTESLLTHPAAFGITTATPAQLAAARILDGRPLGALADHPDAAALVGGADVVPNLPSELGTRPLEVYFLAAIRTAKTITAAAKCIEMSQAVDVSGLGPGEVPRVSWVSLKLDVASVGHGLLLETLRASGLLRQLLVGHTATTVIVRHPSGRLVEIACVAGAEAGGSLVARWQAGIVFDEAPRMHGSDRVVNLDHQRSSVLGRLLPNAQALYIGSPWAPFGPVYDAVTEHWQHPTRNVVVLRGSGPLLNPFHWSMERCAQLQEQDPTAYTTDVLGEFADPESGLLALADIRRSTRQGPTELDPAGGDHVAAMDPSGGGASGNPWTLVILRVDREQDEAGETHVKHRVALAREWRGVTPDVVLREIAALCRRYDLDTCFTDQYSAPAHVALAAQVGLTLEVDATNAPGKLAMYSDLAAHMAVGAIELSPDPQLRRDLLSVRKRVTQTGYTIVLPVTSDGRHADLAAALALAVKHSDDAGGGSMWGSAEQFAAAQAATTGFGSDRWDGMGRGF